MNNLDVRQSRQANDSASIAKRAKERFRNCERFLNTKDFEYEKFLNNVYEYKCHCDSRYVGRTSQQLQDRIKQHVPQWLRQQLTRPRRSQPLRSCKRIDTKPDCDSAIGQHLLDNDRCALNYDDKRFSILATARSSFHLNRLQAAYIKTRRPAICRQKEFVYTLKLFRSLWHLASCCAFSNFRNCEIFLSRALQY